MADSLCRGHTPTSAELRAIANYINVATGRGNLGAFEKHSGALSTVFFAPKLAVSRFEFLFGMPLTAGSGRTRGVIAEQYARYLVGLVVVYGLSRMAGAEVGDDPTSSDAGKIRVGEKTRNDILSGLGQSLVFVSRMAGGVYTTASGKAVDITGPAGKVTEGDVAWRFVRTKLSPLFSANVNLVTGRDVVGEPVTPKDAALDLVVPLVARDVAELYREHQVPTATAEALLSILAPAWRCIAAAGGVMPGRSPCRLRWTRRFPSGRRCRLRFSKRSGSRLLPGGARTRPASAVPAVRARRGLARRKLRRLRWATSSR
jgi:hypothetical protein